MDIEWYEDRTLWFVTQISALRIDENYTVIDQYDVLAAPPASASQARIRWNNLGFSGWNRNDFILASDISSAFANIYTWLEPDDILIWWHVNSEEKFNNRTTLAGLPILTSRIIGPHVRGLIAKGQRKGSPYALCKAHGLQFYYPEHCSMADVQTLLSLLSAVQFPLSLLAEPDWSEKICQARSIELPPREPVSKKHSKKVKQKYLYEKKTQLLHKSTCSKYNSENCIAQIQLQKAVSMQLQPCKCCRKDYEKAFIQHTQTIRASTIVYSTFAHGAIMHHSDCPVVKRINPDYLRTLVSADEAKNAGYHFCKTCSSMERFLKPVKHYMDRYCESHKLKYYLKNGAIHITSQFDKWMIIVDDDTGIPTLYHKNKGHHRDGPPESSIPNYHPQPNSGRSIPVILKNIFNHDQYKGSKPVIELPKKSSKQKSNEKQEHKPSAKTKMHRTKTRIMRHDFDDALQDYYS